MPAVLIDSRANIPAITTASGFEVKAYTDLQVDRVTNTVLPYIIETEFGNLCGYFLLQVDTVSETARLIQKQLRPAFVQFDSQISNEISNFITSNKWQEDFLF